MQDPLRKDDGRRDAKKKVTETYTVDALSFTEAEQRIMEEMSSYISGDFEVADIKKRSLQGDILQR